MSQITVDLRSRIPIFEQIINSVRDLVFMGVLKPDDNLPSVRALALELAINPNTIQKAYAELERQGVIYSLTGRGNFVSSDISHIVNENRKNLLSHVSDNVLDAKRAGISEEEIVAIVKQIYGGEKND